jgi:hypothetical protein
VRLIVCLVQWYFVVRIRWLHGIDGIVLANAQLRPRPTQEARGLSQLLRSWPTKSRKRDLKWSTLSPGYRGYPVPVEQVVEQHSRMHSHFDLHDVAAKCMILKGATCAIARMLQRPLFSGGSCMRRGLTMRWPHARWTISTASRRTQLLQDARTLRTQSSFECCNWNASSTPPPPPHMCAHRYDR